MQKRNFIADAEGIIVNILKELKIFPKESVEKTLKDRKKDLKRYYYSICLDKNNKQYFFKANIVDEKETELAFEREIWLNKAVADFDDKNGPNVQLYAKDGQVEKIRWVLFYYIEGKPIGSIFDFDKEYIDKKDEFISGILNNLTGIQKKTAIMLKNKALPILEKHDGAWYEKEFFNYEKKVVETVGSARYAKLLKIIQKNKDIFDRECKVLCHGDFALSNQIFAKKTGVIHTADWEDVHLNNRAVDIGFLWLQAWKYPLWREKTLNQFSDGMADKKEFLNIFSLVLIQQSVREIMFWRYNDWFEPIKSYVMTKDALRAHLSALDMAEKKFK